MALKSKTEWRELTPLQQDVIDIRIDHPDWTHNQIAEELDTAPSHVSRILSSYEEFVEWRQKDRMKSPDDATGRDGNGDGADELERFEREAEEPGADRDAGRVKTQMGMNKFEGKPLNMGYQNITERPQKDTYVEVSMPQDTVVDLIVEDVLDTHAKRSLLESLLDKHRESDDE